ncbi:MAG: type IV secretion system DNA-binding domain-containing protein [Fimbriimonadaceae bacterium]|nr:type IV secretion system DNA-binding domain-containing protein [Fimbriimonadaceae bacterium]
MTSATTVEIKRVVRSMVSTDFQRKVIPLCAIVLAFGTFELVSNVYRMGPIGGGVAAALQLFLYYARIDKVNPRSAVLFSRFAEYLAKGIVGSLIPVFASIAVFAIAVYLKANNQSAGIAAVIIGGIAWWFSFQQPIPSVVNRLVRGRPEPVDLAESKANEFVLDKNDPGITWGGLRIPSKFATSHFMVVGTTGSGKTVSIQLLMKEVLQTIGTGADHRALIYDAKQDIASQIPTMGIPGKVFTLNPFDERCVAWDMAKDITEPTAALQAAVTLIPSDKNASQPFFVDSAQLLLYGVMLSFIRSGADWRFSDLIRTMQTVERLTRVLEACPEASHIIERFSQSKDTLGEIMATVATKMTPYESIAAMWDLAIDQGRKISLIDWASDRGKDNCVLILGNNERARAAIDRINQVVFKRVSELLLDQPEDRMGARRSWLFLDEIGEAGKLEGLTSLLTKGRSKGACMVLGFQDIDSLREVYGENIAGVITSQCNCKAILRLESPRTAEWASKLFGEYEAIETRRSEARGTTTPTGIGGSQGSKSHTVTDTEHYIKRQSVMESQLYLIPVTTPETGLTGYYVVPGIGAYRHTYPGAWLFPDEKNSALPAAEVNDFQPWGDPHAQWLKPWNEEQLCQRGIVVTEAVKTAVAQGTRTAVGGEVTEATVERPPEPRIATEEEAEDFIKKRLTRRFKARKEE